MARYLIVDMVRSDKSILSLIASLLYTDGKRNPPKFIESSKWGFAPVSTAEQVIEGYQGSLIYSRYRTMNDVFPPVYRYYPVEATDADAEWVVYREADNGDLLCIGGVGIECVRPEYHVCSACGARNPEPGHSCGVLNS
jgi:hypothetical protein